MESELEGSDSFSITEFLEQMCPVYMSYGMSYEDYWHGEYEMTKMYREAYKIRLQRENSYAHRQGAYVYEAFVKGIANTFGKSKDMYSSEPYPLSEEEAEERKAEKERLEYEDMKERMKERFEKINKKKRGD